MICDSIITASRFYRRFKIILPHRENSEHEPLITSVKCCTWFTGGCPIVTDPLVQGFTILNPIHPYDQIQPRFTNRKLWVYTGTATQATPINFARQAKDCISINKKSTKCFRPNLKRLTDVDALTGHFPSNKHLYNIEIKNSPLCDKFEYIESSERFLCLVPSLYSSKSKTTRCLPYSTVQSLPPKDIIQYLNSTNRI